LALDGSDVIQIDATIIIGLLILLTFQSVSSSFIEGESKEFSSALLSSDKTFAKFDELVLFCDDIVGNPESFEQNYKKFVTDYVAIDPPPVYYNIRGFSTAEDVRDYNYQRDLPPQLYTEFLSKCAEWESERIEIIHDTISLEDWGIRYGYLDEVGQESIYLKNLASGPFYVNLINLGMVFPFLVSAIAEAIIQRRKKDDDNASRIGVGFMVLGFVFVIGGLIAIANAFYEASAPFLF
jgi:hypothetical protein